jgi:tetratricopeptide (TPR) repeat protein
VEATLYETRSGVPAIVSRALVEGAADSVFLLSDSLAGQLAAGRGSASDERMARLAATTTSLRALRPYFEGQRALREGNLTLAGEQFRHSVTIDSAFSLGWFRLAGTATWMLDPATARAGAERALRTSAALPEVDRALLSAFAAYVDGRFVDAEKRYRAITVSWPEESEGWRGLGEVLFHYNWIAGRRAAEARTAWERVLRADPSDWGALAHLSEVAAREGRPAEVDSLVSRQLRGDSSDLLRLPAQALRAFALHDVAEQDRVVAQLRKTTHLWSMLAAWNVAVDLGDLAGAERLTRVLADSARRPEVRALAHLTLAHLQLARGRRNAAFAEIDSVESFYPPWGPPYRGLLLSLPWVPAAKEELIRARERLARGSVDSPAPHIVTPSPWISTHESIAPYVGTYVRALLSLRLGEPQLAGRLADSLERRTGDSEATALAIDLGRTVRAGDLATRGQREAALALISEHGPDLPFVYPWTSPVYSRGLPRYQRASLLASLGRSEEAIRAFGGFADNSLFDLIFVAPAHLERARLLERTGQSAAARQELEAFIALWRDCDPELRPALRESEAALERLRDR